MPYIKPLNLLFIHIPKTGGVSVTKYFFEKFNIKEDGKEVLYTKRPYKDPHFKVSYGHLRYIDIISNSDKFNLDFENINLMTVVRNPYLRIISDLIFTNKIKTDSTQLFVQNEIEKYLTSNCVFDNHKITQYEMLADRNNNIPKNLIIIRNETLTEDMCKLSYIDFNKYLNNSNNHKIEYMSLLNEKSISLINNYYRKDFETFGYQII